MDHERLKQIIFGGIAIVMIAVLCWRVWSWVDAGRPNGHLPSNFPYAFMPAGTVNDVTAVHVWRGRVPPTEMPLTLEGVECWPVYQCLNDNCPGRVDDQPFFFPFGYAPNLPKDQRPEVMCVACAKAQGDPTRLGPWLCPEAAHMMEKINAALSAR